MKEYLFRISLKHIKSGEKISLYVWAKNVYDATHSLCGSLIGYKSEYEWCGSGPEYENNKLIERDVNI